MKGLEKLFGSLVRVGFYCLMCAGLWAMLSASTSYLDLRDAHPFFLEKLPLRHPALWLFALYVHVPTALFALPACLVLQIKQLSGRWPRFHRWLGRTTAVTVLGGVVPSGMYLAWFATGGLVTALGFWLTGAITFVAMVASVRSARARRLREHRRFSAHVTGQLAVAVLSRVLLMAAEEADLYAEWVYVAALWVPVVGCALAAELMGRGGFKLWKGSRNEKVAPVTAPHAVR